MELLEAQSRIEELKIQIREWNQAYFNENKELFPESIRDQLKKELIQLETKYPQFCTPDSPTQRVGVPLDGKLPKVPHTNRRYSLSDVFDREELLDFDTRVKKFLKEDQIDYSCELKIDGIHITLRYEKGVFVQALTRGDGLQGEDVTHTIKTCKNIPQQLPIPISAEFSGECFIAHSDFERINADLEPDNKFANARNLAAGSVRQLNPAIADSRNLRVFLYEMVSDEKSIQNQTELFLFFESIGIPHEKEYIVFDSIQAVIDFCSEWSQPQKRQSLWYDIDGIVVKIHDFQFRERLGYTAKTAKYAVAWKFPAEEKHTTVLDLQFQVGRTGAITPVALLEPVFISGSTVQKATLHNMEELQRKDVRIGDMVLLRKAGDIIPEIITSIPELRVGTEIKVSTPTHCPECESVLNTSEIVFRCENRDCPAQKKSLILYFAQTLELEGFGEKTIEALLEYNMIQSSADLWKLDHHDLARLPGFKHKKVYNLLDSLEARKRVLFSTFLTALGIRHIGKENALLIAQFLRDQWGDFSFSFFVNHLPQLLELRFEQVDGIGLVVHESMLQFFTFPKNQIFIRQFLDYGIDFIWEEKTSSDHALSSKRIVITGTFEGFSRDELKKKITQINGKVLSAISSHVDFLFSGDKPGSKYKKAIELGIPICDETQILELIPSLKNEQDGNNQSQKSLF